METRGESNLLRKKKNTERGKPVTDLLRKPRKTRKKSIDTLPVRGRESKIRKRAGLLKKRGDESTEKRTEAQKIGGERKVRGEVQLPEPRTRERVLALRKSVRNPGLRTR